MSWIPAHNQVCILELSLINLVPRAAARKAYGERGDTRVKIYRETWDTNVAYPRIQSISAFQCNYLNISKYAQKVAKNILIRV